MMRCQDRFTRRDIKTAHYPLLVLSSFISNLNDEAAPTRMVCFPANKISLCLPLDNIVPSSQLYTDYRLSHFLGVY